MVKPSYQEQSKGFVKSIFDFSFQHYITPKIMKVLYGLAMVVVGITFLFYIALAFKANTALGLIFLILSPVFFIIYMAFIRMFYEVFMAIFSIAENSRIMVAQGQASAGPNTSEGK